MNLLESTVTINKKITRAARYQIIDEQNQKIEDLFH